ncbi:MAG: hypothetical protein SGI87_03690, partial [Flavobacteriales bacterium]|nr:hypothetical protein [Flavobacteriales bacterium]
MNIKLFSIVSIAISALVACSSGGSKGSISGKIEGAEGETIYLIRQVNNKSVKTDSSVIGPDGQFNIIPAISLALDYYNLQLGNDNIMLITDSTECLAISTSRSEFRKSAQVSGSEATAAIQELNSSLEPLALRSQELIQKMKDFAITAEAKASAKAQMTELN